MIGSLLSGKVPFALFKTPEDKVPWVIIQEDSQPLSFNCPGERFVSGFYFMPCGWGKSKHGYRIRADRLAHISLKQLGESAFGDAFHFARENTVVPLVTREDFIHQVRRAKEWIQNGRVEKLVLSRPVRIDKPGDFYPGRFFVTLVRLYPELFSFFVHIPGRVTWAGATPELLAGKRDDTLVVSALAGTRSGKLPGDIIEWSQKEKHEHRVVKKHIGQVLDRLDDVSPRNGLEETVWSGNLAHLRTLFSIPFPGIPGVLEQLISELSPTPAVGGYPVKKAIDLLRQVEHYDRSFYTGYLGPWDLNGISSFYVNLRSVQFTDRSFVIYTGAGITAGSDPEEEWVETEYKAAAILSVLEKMSNFTQ